MEIEICRKMTSFTLNMAYWKSSVCMYDFPRLIILPFEEEHSRLNMAKESLY